MTFIIVYNQFTYQQSCHLYHNHITYQQSIILLSTTALIKILKSGRAFSLLASQNLS